MWGYEERMTDKPYHHGDLRSALLAAAEAELEQNGVEGFSLRAVAKRAGVSHAAPAHHFGDASGLLTALAADAYRTFLAMQHAREDKAPRDPHAQLVAAGLGYIDFALAKPALFRLIFGSDRPDHDDPALHEAAKAAYNHLNQGVARAGSVHPMDAVAVWSMAHGLADLMASGRLAEITTLPGPARDAALAEILARAFPAP
jgi:AcrR family transcriptional regulator